MSWSIGMKVKQSESARLIASIKSANHVPVKRKLTKIKPHEFVGLEAGAWVEPARYHYRLACCDCGLTHYFDFRVRNGRAQFCVWRATHTTKAVRRALPHRFALKRKRK